MQLEPIEDPEEAESGTDEPSSSIFAKVKSNRVFGSSMHSSESSHAVQSAPNRQPLRDLPRRLARQKSAKKDICLPFSADRRRGSQSEKSEGLRNTFGRASAPSGRSRALMGPAQPATSSRLKTMGAKAWK
uniref:Uncharacterized protein n=1 Tax=Chromera velia CCMP2878 TaxID=1169474 RepID=A0A0G4FX91_9ALVE|eukprot:Cvel_19142.t1-p1 / transcript=Cvel_19142.t1 / gene=Cvel_19142 / organism=Chromera_velia_CCMP2878 / gene_product=hypothetical protein / transcript_product=hypothetical protein / location=Cvel_scaffold1628:29852-31508(+) / protein_length=130 / sequence_SO=supercontig / SO=protein_coding / is_pseudo=false